MPSASRDTSTPGLTFRPPAPSSKNLALLKIAEPGDEQLRSVRMAPLYDPVATRVFPRLQRDRMALKVSGKDDRLRRADFRALASTAGVRAADADAAINEMTQRIRQAANRTALPDLPGSRAEAETMTAKMLEMVRMRIDSFE